jgi:ribose 5-phosphate isomerase A
MTMPVGADTLKQQAAEAAVRFVESGMVVGLGEGSTAIHAVRMIAERLRTGQVRDLLGVPCSLHMQREAARLGIPLTTLEEHPVVDLTIDGADEVSPQLALIKGGGGALLREKIVAQASRREVIIVDESKLSPALGTRWAVPVEVVPFGWLTQLHYLESLGARVVLRRHGDGVPAQGAAAAAGAFRTDQGNLILDCAFGPIPDPARLAAQLDRRTGIVGHGLFLDLTTDVLVARPGGVEHLSRNLPGTF